MVATTTSTDRRAAEVGVTDTDAGVLVEEARGVWRWHCAACPGRSVGTYPTFAAVKDALDRHHEAAGSLHR